MQRQYISLPAGPDKKNEEKSCPPADWIEGGIRSGAMTGFVVVGGAAAIPGMVCDGLCGDPTSCKCGNICAVGFGGVGAVVGGVGGGILGLLSSPLSFFGNSAAKCKEFNEENSCDKLLLPQAPTRQRMD